jgi:hypothetical protein
MAVSSPRLIPSSDSRECRTSRAFLRALPEPEPLRAEPMPVGPQDEPEPPPPHYRRAAHLRYRALISVQYRS